MTILFYAPQMEELAVKTHDYVQWRNLNQPCGLGAIEWNTFPDGTPDLFIRNVDTVRGQDVAFLASFNHQEPGVDLFSQLAVIDALPRYFARRLRIILPYDPFATKDRVQRNGEIATSRTLARFLEATPPTHGGGVPYLSVYDIHALGERFHFSDDIVVDTRSTHSLIRTALDQKGGAGKYTIVFPDEGAYKRFASDWTGYDYIQCSKVRDGDRRVVTITDGSPRDRHLVIVDDLIQSAVTLLECRHKLMLNHAASVSVYAAHAVCPRDSWLKLTPDLFADVWITDSCPIAAKRVVGTNHIHVLSLAPLIAQDLTW